jgi:hypothetical protein
MTYKNDELTHAAQATARYTRHIRTAHVVIAAILALWTILFLAGMVIGVEVLIHTANSAHNSWHYN